MNDSMMREKKIQDKKWTESNMSGWEHRQFTSREWEDQLDSEQNYDNLDKNRSKMRQRWLWTTKDRIKTIKASGSCWRILRRRILQ